MQTTAARVLISVVLLWAWHCFGVQPDPCSSALVLLKRFREVAAALGPRIKIPLIEEVKKAAEIQTHWSVDLGRRQRLGNATLYFRNGEILVDYIDAEPDQTFPIAQFARILRETAQGATIRFLPGHNRTRASLFERLRNCPEWPQVNQAALHLTPESVIKKLEEQMNAELNQHTRDPNRRLPLVSVLRRAGFQDFHVTVDPPTPDIPAFDFEITAK